MKERGFTLVEILVSLLLLEVITAFSIREVAQYLRASRDNQIRTEAAQAAQMVLDDLRASDPALLPVSGEGNVQTVPVGAHSFQVTPRYCVMPEFCTSAAIRHIRVSVSLNDRIWYEVDTAFAQLQ